MNTTTQSNPRIAALAATGIVTMLVALSTIIPSAVRAQTASPDFSLAPTVQLGFFTGIQPDSQFTAGASANAVGGTSTTGFAWVTGGGAAPGGVTVTLSSSNPGIATVSPSVLTIPEGVSIGRFTVSTARVTAPVSVSISGTDGTTTFARGLVIWPPDSVSVKLAQYDRAKGQLSIEATTTPCSGCGFSLATLTAFVTATGQAIGTVPQDSIGKYKGQLAWPVNPQTITVKSSQGGSDTVTVVAK